ncbi:hypothetical protein CHS0354_027795 [Potamilus streckersoni]|uniref:C1q domain-containing protein n=1 Tax=Potamilus streckersoni TaxID=2493646 RepID=A0AAE0W582_9BIVA|nr:hypothetical protein CHS0354_027795 [Potamilus streckersoni]
MLPIHLLLVTTTCTTVGTAILEKVGEADLDAVRIRLEEEKAKRLLLENDVETLMVQVEELKRGFSQILKDQTASSGNVTSIRASIGFTATLSKDTTHVLEQTVIFDNVKVNEGNCYDSSTGRFRAPFRGLYIFSVTILKLSSTNVHLLIMKDNVEIGRVFSGTSLSDSGSVTVVTVMEKGQVSYVKEFSGNTETIHGDNWASFTGLLQSRYN